MTTRPATLCVVCEQMHVETQSDDPDVCISCQRRIDLMTKDPMTYARAAGMAIDAIAPDHGISEYEKRREQLVMLGFLSTFHPEMPMKKRLALSRSGK